MIRIILAADWQSIDLAIQSLATVSSTTLVAQEIAFLPACLFLNGLLDFHGNVATGGGFLRN